MFVKKSPTGIGWVLLAISLTASWLVPIHSEPWPTFYSEVIACLILAPLFISTFWAARDRIVVDKFACVFAVAAAIPLLQAAAGFYLFAGEANIVSLYLAGLFLTIVAARRSAEIAPQRLHQALFTSLIIASLVSTALAIAQWLKLDWGLLLAAIPEGGRTVANVGQPNELATLLVWGLVGIWWAHTFKHLNGATSAFASGFILIGIASTQSRTGALAIVGLFILAQSSPLLAKNLKYRIAFVGLAVWFAILVLSWTTLNQMVAGGSLRDLNDQLSSGARPEIWAMMIEGVKHHPWIGYGWNQGRMVQLEVLPDFADLKVGVQHAHNFVLDLIVWNGLPLGLTFAASVGLWFLWQIKKISSYNQFFLLVALCTFALHAMLELPHCKSFFLVPVGIMIGILNFESDLPVLFRMPRYLTMFGSIAITVVLVISWVDYQRIEDDLLSYRMRMAHVGNIPVPLPPRIHILYGLQEALVNVRIPPRSNMAKNELHRLQITATRYPVDSVLFIYAEAAALNGRPEEAKLSLLRLCLLHPKIRCDQYRNSWSTFVEQHLAKAEVFRKLFPAESS